MVKWSLAYKELKNIKECISKIETGKHCEEALPTNVTDLDMQIENMRMHSIKTNRDDEKEENKIADMRKKNGSRLDP